MQRFALVVSTLALVVAAAPALAQDAERHWLVDDVRFDLRTSGLPVGLAKADVLAAVEASMATWNEVGTGPALVVAADTSAPAAVAQDGVNSIFFVTSGWEGRSDQLALTYSHVDAATGEVLEVDMALNAAHHLFTVGAPSGAGFDLQNLVTHELGHALGLGHLDEEESTMFASIRYGETEKRELADADVSALLALYEGIADGASAGCAEVAPSSPLFAALLLGVGLLAPARRRLRR